MKKHQSLLSQALHRLADVGPKEPRWLVVALNGDELLAQSSLWVTE